MLTNVHTLIRTQPSPEPYFLSYSWSLAVDIKADNLLANNDNGYARSGTTQIGDFGDSVLEGIATNNAEHIISAPIYRVPGVMLNARWTVAVDIGPLGATVSSMALYRCLHKAYLLLLLGGHMLPLTATSLRA